MAGKSGGAWKVAYADFVTAMMAFFLVMWIMSQDKKLKRAVAHYFSDPAGFTITGNSSSPTSSGALFQSDVQGNVPELDNQSMGRGSAAYTEHGQLDRKTQMVSDWLRNDQPSYQYWCEQAAQQRRLAAQSPMVKNKVWTVDEAASVQLSQQMKAELVESAPRHNSQFYDQLLDASLSDINWRGLAEEYLTE